LTVRKAPRLSAVELADGGKEELPARIALRDFVRPPDRLAATE
jgi:hypothetical protein